MKKRTKAIKLTEDLVDLAIYSKPREQRGYRCVLWDLDVVGFGLRVYQSGRKSYVFSFRQKGIKRLWVIGKQCSWSLKEARIAARNLSREIEPIYE